MRNQIKSPILTYVTILIYTFGNSLASWNREFENYSKREANFKKISIFNRVLC